MVSKDSCVVYLLATEASHQRELPPNREDGSHFPTRFGLTVDRQAAPHPKKFLLAESLHTHRSTNTFESLMYIEPRIEASFEQSEMCLPLHKLTADPQSNIQVAPASPAVKSPNLKTGKVSLIHLRTPKMKLMIVPCSHGQYLVRDVCCTLTTSMRPSIDSTCIDGAAFEAFACDLRADTTLAISASSVHVPHV